MKARDQVRNELLAVIKRYSDESDLSVMDAISILHEVVSILVLAALATRR